jgi:putative exporter of polyketide antibiotics
MAFDDPFSVADQYYHSHRDLETTVTESNKLILIALSIVSLLLAAVTIGFVVKKEREEQERTKNR